MDRCITTNGKRQTEPEYATTNDFTFLQTEWTEGERAKYTYQQSCTIKTTTEEEARYALKSAEGWADQVAGTGLSLEGRKHIETLALQDSGSGKGLNGPNARAAELPRPASPADPQAWSTTPLVVREVGPVPTPSGGDCGYGECNTKKDGADTTFTKLGNEVGGQEEEEHRVELYEENEDRRREREQLLAKPLPVLNVCSVFVICVSSIHKLQYVILQLL